ncbi:MAG: WYL domain-containing protein [Saprospiraceae bacterium]|jgi:predicted DNA-binding transcriptional regulator YafY|nr:WYL domain-containing protein [Saprospiraceae bacterium]
MAENKPRLTRLSAILTQLQSRKIITAKQLAERHQVSIRTIYRDIRTLEQSGIPIITEEGRGYSIMEGYKLPPVMFTEDEAIALIIAEQLILKNKDQSLAESYERAITKIKSILKHNQKTNTEFLTSRLQIRNNPKEEKTSRYLIQLQSNITHFQVIEIDYLSVEKYASQRKVEPFALYTTKDNWILIAFCRKRADYRAFRLDRIQSLRVTNEQFTPHGITLEQYLENCRKQWENTPDIQLSQAPNTFALNQKNKVMQRVKVKPFNLIGIAIRTTNENGQAEKEIAGLWNTFLAENTVEQIPNKIDPTIYSLYTDYEDDHTKPYTAILGCKVSTLDNIPQHMIGKSFEGGDYIKTSVKGDLMQGLILKEWSRIFTLDMDRNFEADFEVFGEKAQNPSNAEVDFYVGVKN